ncbi:MAG: DUF839 domain-containing protein [Opitutaceae bacterium]|nr:DUF839 domain-containing protein [Opitutaceae bacterium]
MISRRSFIRNTMLTTAGFAGLRTLVNHGLFAAAPTSGVGFGPLQVDVQGLLKVPAGFSYQVFSRTGELMPDGFYVPGAHDGMAAFAGPDGLTLLVRNHELESEHLTRGPYGRDNALLGKVPPGKIYDRGNGIRPNLGGTTTLVFDTRTQELRNHYLSLAGTVRNCAGGPTPWGTWVTCEEMNAQPEDHAEMPHGFNFEVCPSAEPGLVTPIPLKAMGRFRHEAIAVDARSGAVYETEDLADGLLYRFLPKEPGNLAAGGKLQALGLVDTSITDTRNLTAPQFAVGQPLAVRWIDLDEPESPRDDLRFRGAAAGAVPFARGEGAWTAEDGSVYFAMTIGGPKGLGQIFRYVPSPFEGTAREGEQPGRLELFAEPNNAELLRNCDNLSIAPWGDLLICEDHAEICRIIGVTPRGEFYVIAENTEPKHELAGVCFSPDGTTLFFNVQNPGYTVAITGPWEKRLHG